MKTPRLEVVPDCQCCLVTIGDAVIYIDFEELVSTPSKPNGQVLIDVWNRDSGESATFRCYGEKPTHFLERAGTASPRD